MTHKQNDMPTEVNHKSARSCSSADEKLVQSTEPYKQAMLSFALLRHLGELPLLLHVQGNQILTKYGNATSCRAVAHTLAPDSYAAQCP